MDAVGSDHSAGTDPHANDAALATALRVRQRGVLGGWDQQPSAPGAELAASEAVLAVRPMAAVARPAIADGVTAGLLAVTTERLVLVDGHTETLAMLDQLDDVMVVADRLLILLADGGGFAIEAEQPRLLRVQLAGARSAHRAAQRRASPDGATSTPRRP